jgi:hypothetical protein
VLQIDDLCRKVGELVLPRNFVLLLASSPLSAAAPFELFCLFTCSLFNDAFSVILMYSVQ